jgi:cytochrome b subunit of formate dehydrogenase
MIQRVQTLFLIGAIILIVFADTKIFPFASLIHGVSPSDPNYNEYNDGVYSMTDNKALFILSNCIIGALINGIILFKNRKSQTNIIILGNLLIGFLIVGVAYFSKNAATHLLSEPNGTSPEIQTNPIPYAFLIIALALSGLAIFYIRKDEKLVRSADRLR